MGLETRYSWLRYGYRAVVHMRFSLSCGLPVEIVLLVPLFELPVEYLLEC